MTDSELTKFPTAADLLANRPEDPNDPVWVTDFNAATTLEYLTGWFAWYQNNREQFRAEKSKELLPRTIRQCGQMGDGHHVPWFPKAVRVVRDFDPDIQKPILTYYFAAKLEALSSLGTFQKIFGEGGGFSTLPEVRSWLNSKIKTATEEKSSLPLQFIALANAYQHVFSFLIRVHSQFTDKYDRVPSLQEFDYLTRQLVMKLHHETKMSRKENAILELHFNFHYNFFSFTAEGEKIKLGINYPSDEERIALLAKLEHIKDVMPGERHMQDVKSERPGHHGCPAAFAQHNGRNLTGFTFDEVIDAVRRAMWPPEGFDMRPVVPYENAYRMLGLGG